MDLIKFLDGLEGVSEQVERAKQFYMQVQLFSLIGEPAAYLNEDKGGVWPVLESSWTSL